MYLKTLLKKKNVFIDEVVLIVNLRYERHNQVH